MRTAVAIDALGGVTVAALHRFAVKAAVVGGLLIGVAGRAGDLLRRSFVPGSLYICVAVDASEHAAVNGIFERLRVNMQAGRLAVDVMGQRCVAMAGQTFIGGRFLRRFCGGVCSCGSKKRG